MRHEYTKAGEAAVQVRGGIGKEEGLITSLNWREGGRKEVGASGARRGG